MSNSKQKNQTLVSNFGSVDYAKDVKTVLMMSAKCSLKRNE